MGHLINKRPDAFLEVKSKADKRSISFYNRRRSKAAHLLIYIVFNARKRLAANTHAQIEVLIAFPSFFPRWSRHSLMPTAKTTKTWAVEMIE